MDEGEGELFALICVFHVYMCTSFVFVYVYILPAFSGCDFVELFQDRLFALIGAISAELAWKGATHPPSTTRDVAFPIRACIILKISK